MKILTIAIPSYNSMDYMRNCIESLLPGGEDVEILMRFIRKTVDMERQ